MLFVSQYCSVDLGNSIRAFCLVSEDRSARGTAAEGLIAPEQSRRLHSSIESEMAAETDHSLDGAAERLQAFQDVRDHVEGAVSARSSEVSLNEG
jgi:hypothetical protein